jgi:hypothetical protein
MALREALLTEWRIAMAGPDVSDERCEALFASALQRSDALTAEAISDAISRAVQELGSGGCACRMAQEFGDHPEEASERMQWARRVISDLPGSPPSPPSGPSSPAAPSEPSPSAAPAAPAAPSAPNASRIRRAA